MAPNKFEFEIKEQLETREIRPSTQAWDRLDAMLSSTEKQKKKFPWLLIAASFIGFMFVGTMIYKLNNIVTIKGETPSSTVTSSAVEMQNQNSKTSVAVVKSVVVEIQDQNTQKSSEVVKSSAVKMQNKTNLVSKSNLVMVQNSKNNLKVKEQSNVNEQQVSNKGVSINNQNQIAVNQKQEVSNQNSVNYQTTTNNIEEVLIMVKPKETRKSTLKVNPITLLSQVDGEVTTEFRDNVFTKVSKSFQTVKVALSERNNTK